MIKMIIADDEPVIIRGIKKLLDWESMGIQIVGEYADGRQALDGILALKPEIALLDISMPGLTGIDVLKELKAQNEKTNVIFISGFQDFEYAKSAVRFGAMDYLLKPVIRGELLSALERCVPLTNDPQPLFSQNTDYSALLGMEENQYVTMMAVPLLAGRDGHMRKLMEFSVTGALEEALKADDAGILFNKDGHTILVLKGMDRSQALAYITGLEERLAARTGIHICILAAGLTDSLSCVREQYSLCLKNQDLPFFASFLSCYCFDLLAPLLHAPADSEDAMEKLMKIRSQMKELLFAQKQEAYEKAYQQFCRSVVPASAGSRENACYYFCSTLRLFAEDLAAAHIPFDEPDTTSLLETGRTLETYQEMTDLFREPFRNLFQKVREKAAAKDLREIDLAVEYIEKHFAEPLTLEILANVVHMNPYYFSSYFKKNTGINFKDYLGSVRLRHAMTLLVTTDRTTYDIASASGFSDSRAFSDLFQKTYGEKPSAYRKRVRAAAEEKQGKGV